MSKRRFFCTILLAALLLISLASCRSDGPAGTDITGLWSGYVLDSYGSTVGPVVFEFSIDGALKMGDIEDEIIYDEAIQQKFTWSLGDDYLIVTGWLGMYRAEYAYDLSGDSLTLVLIRRNFFNETYEEINCGDLFDLELDEDHEFDDYFDGTYDPTEDYSYYY